MKLEVNSIIKYSFRVLVLINACFAIVYFLSRPIGGGDELLFLNDLELLSNNFLLALQKGISAPYLLLVLPFSIYLKNYVALRMVSILIFILFLAYFYYYRKFKNTDFYFFLVFFFSATGYNMIGTNDMLFFAALSVFFSESYFILRSNKIEKGEMLCIALIMAIFTRALFLVYLPGILLAFYVLLKNYRRIKISVIPVLAVLSILFLLNAPSLLENNRLSLDYKKPPEGVTATWSQRQYYAQLLVNEGKIENYHHPSWAQTMEYLKLNGENALPKSIFQAILYNPMLTAKEFFKDFMDCLFYGLRQTGLILPITLGFGILFFKRKKELNFKVFIPLIILMMLSVFSLITISFVESRWLAPVFIVSILFFANLVKMKKIPLILLNLNYLFIGFSALYGSYIMFFKLVSRLS